MRRFLSSHRSAEPVRGEETVNRTVDVEDVRTVAAHVAGPAHRNPVLT